MNCTTYKLKIKIKKKRRRRKENYQITPNPGNLINSQMSNKLDSTDLIN
jgi:hypothetical protein